MDGFLVDIPAQIHKIARSIASQQQNPDQVEKVYLNGLAVYSANVYLRCMGIAVDLASSDSQNLLFQTLSNTGSLTLPGLGRLECRPVMVNSNEMYVPEDVWGDRIGYLAIQLSSDRTESTLVGFVKEVEKTHIPLDTLESLDALLDYLDQLTQQQFKNSSSTIANASIPTSSKSLSGFRLISISSVNHLSQWLNQVVDFGWEIIEDIVNDVSGNALEPEMAFRQKASIQSFTTTGAIQCGKVLNLDDYSEQSQLKLLVGLRPHTNEKYQIRVRLCPTQTPYLIPGLQVALLDNTEATVSQNQMPDQQPHFDLIFSGSLGDQFSVRISHKDRAIEEKFVI